METGRPNLEAIKMVVAVASSAQKPPLGCRGIMPSPMVVITFLPQMAKPATMPAPPSTKIQMGIVKPFRGTVPVRFMWRSQQEERSHSPHH